MSKNGKVIDIISKKAFLKKVTAKEKIFIKALEDIHSPSIYYVRTSYMAFPEDGTEEEFNALLGERLKGNSSKMDKLANRSKEGNLSSFSGVFKLSEVTEEEKNAIREILLSHTDENQDISSDLSKLITLTSEKYNCVH